MRPGCICCSRRRGIEVGAIDEKGPAYTAGVRKKDVLVALRGKPASALKLSEIRRVLGQEGQPVTMSVERGDERIEVRFTPYEFGECKGKQ